MTDEQIQRIHDRAEDAERHAEQVATVARARIAELERKLAIAVKGLTDAWQHQQFIGGGQRALRSATYTILDNALRDIGMEETK